MISRRQLFKTGACLASAALPFLLWRSRRALGRTPRLVPDPKGILDLPQGFSYTVVDRAGEAMSDDYRVPGRPDGMACFAGPNDALVLMRNHELDVDPGVAAYRKAPDLAYDRAVFGSVTRVVLDRNGQRVSSNLVLAGTLRNCSGGSSPWGWLSAEESVAPEHGYVFRCSPEASALRAPDRISAYGRFMHEAVCIDPRTNAAYLTEDQGDGCFYRFMPHDPAAPFVGKLQALCVEGVPKFDTGFQEERESRAVKWVDVPEPNPQSDSVRYQAQERGAALVRRGEGVTFHDGLIYIAATNGGEAGLGQILCLRDGARPQLEVLAAAPSIDVLEMPDNIVVAPWGDVIVAEDGLDKQQFVRGVTPQGAVYDIARNAARGGEFSGVCFSPDHGTLFVNLQYEGLTLAIRGKLRGLSAQA